MRNSRTRDSVRKSAAALFATKGFAATTTREICQRARVTKPVLYYYFESKDRLYRELLLEACKESRERLSLAARNGRNAREKLIDVLTADFALTRQDPSLSLMWFRMIFAPRKEEPKIDYVEMAMQWLRLVAGIVADGVRSGELEGKPREIAEAFMGIHMIYTMSFLLTGKPRLNRPLARRIVKLVLEGCGR